MLYYYFIELKLNLIKAMRIESLPLLKVFHIKRTNGSEFIISWNIGPHSYVGIIMDFTNY